MSSTFHRKSPLKLTPIARTPLSKDLSRFCTYSFIKGLGGLGLLCLILGFAFITVRQESVYASQEVAGRSPITADQGIKGYVVGSGDVSAYACPDVNTAKCPIKLTLKPGTQVVILDNVIGANVPVLNDNAWRKIAYQGQTLFVPMRYISVTPPDNASAADVQDVSFTQTSNEDDSTTPPASPGGFSTAPASRAGGVVRCPTCRLSCPNPGEVIVGARTVSGILLFVCCPQVDRYDPSAPLASACIAPRAATFYQATDGRIDGNAGDRIAIYCRRTGRIEVWSINDSQGHFLVEFNHTAVDATGRVGLSVNLGNQGVVTIGGDGQGQYWVALFGGLGHGTGSGDFAKIFHCYDK